MVRGMNGRGGGAYADVVGDLGGPSAGRVRPQGNIETLASGSLRVRVFAGTDVLTGQDLYLKQTVPAGPRARRRAQEVLDELVRQVRQGRQPRTNASVRQLVEKHLEVAAVERRGRDTLRGYARKHIAPLIGDRAIGSLTAEVLDCFYAELRRCRDHCDGRAGVVHASSGDHGCDRRCRRHVCRPLAAGTVRHIHYLLSAAYENAIRWEWVSVNPMSRARKPAAPRPDPQPPTAQEAAALVAQCWRAGFGPLVWLAMTTGARRGELCALRWRNLQADHGVGGEHDCQAGGCRWQLVIRRAIGEGHDGTLWETDTKVHQRRHVALDGQTVAVLLEHRQRCEDIAGQLGVTLDDDHFIFASGPDGATPSRPSTVSQRYANCAKRLGIRTTLHRLRHYSATELITAGVDVRTVAGRLGHSDGTTTLKVYAAWVSAADQHASAVLMNRMPQRPPAQLDERDRARVQPRWPHERIAASLYEDWRAGVLPAGTVLTHKEIARSHEVSVGTGHRVLALLNQWGVLQVRNGHPSLVLPCPDTPAALGSVPADTAAPAELGAAASTAATSTNRDQDGQPVPSRPAGVSLLRLRLLHLGNPVRSFATQADPDDFATLQQLLADAVGRAGGDRARIGEYELQVHLGDQPQPLTTVVMAA
jgi:integrase